MRCRGATTRTAVERTDAARFSKLLAAARSLPGRCCDVEPSRSEAVIRGVTTRGDVDKPEAVAMSSYLTVLRIAACDAEEPQRGAESSSRKLLRYRGHTPGCRTCHVPASGAYHSHHSNGFPALGKLVCTSMLRWPSLSARSHCSLRIDHETIWTINPSITP